MKPFVLSLSLVAVLAGCSGAGGSPGETVQEFTRRLDSGECAGLGDLVAKSTAPASAGREDHATTAGRACTRRFEQLNTMPVEAQNRVRVAAVNILDTREEGDRAITKVEVESRSGEKLKQLVALTRQDGRWRFDLERTQGLLSADPEGPIPSPSAEAPMMPPMMGPPPGMEEMAPPSQPMPAEPMPAEPPPAEKR